MEEQILQVQIKKATEPRGIHDSLFTTEKLHSGVPASATILRGPTLRKHAPHPPYGEKA